MTKEIEFEFKGYRFKVTDYDYSPGYSGNYNNPPEPPEFIINELEIQEQYVKNPKWEKVPYTMLSFLVEQVDDLESAAYDAFIDFDIELDVERKLQDEQGSSNSLA